MAVNSFTFPKFQVFVPAQTPNGGLIPAALYKVKFYAAGTTTAKAVYTDPDLTVPFSPPSVVTLDANGQALIYLGNGAYKMIVTDPDDTPVPGYEVDNIIGGGTFGTGFVASIIASDDPPTNGLAELNTNLNLFTLCAGYYEKGDGGQSFFYNITSSTPENGVSCFASTFDPTKRWFKIPDEQGTIRAASGGYIPTTGTVQTTQLQAADAYCVSVRGKLLIEAGADAQVGDITLSSPFIEFEPNAIMKGAVVGEGFATLNFQGLVSGSLDKHFTRFDSISMLPQQIAEVEWFGAIPDDSGETVANGNAIQAANDASPGLVHLGPAPYYVEDGYELPEDVIFKIDGDIRQVDETILYGPGIWNGGQNISGALVAGELIATTTTGGSGAVRGKDIYAEKVAAAGGTITAEGDITSAEDIAGNTLAATTTVAAGTTVTAGTVVTAGTNVEAVNHVIAGKTAGTAGTLQAQAGTSGAWGKAPIGLLSILGAGTGTVAAATLTTNNDRLDFEMSGYLTNASAGGHTFSVQLGAATIASFATTVAGTTYDYAFTIRGKIWRTGASAWTCIADIIGLEMDFTPSANLLDATCHSELASGTVIAWASSHDFGVTGFTQTSLCADLVPA